MDEGDQPPAARTGRSEGRMIGDVAYDEALGHVGAITPVPGGWGQPPSLYCCATPWVPLHRNAGVALDKSTAL